MTIWKVSENLERQQKPGTSLRLRSDQEMLSVRVLKWSGWTIWTRRVSPACMNNEIKQRQSQLRDRFTPPENKSPAWLDSRPAAGLSGINQTPGRTRKHISVSGLWQENKP